MDSKCYLWIFNNLSKYEFNNESIEIKESIGRLLITEESINSSEINAKMEEYYSQLTNSFYNNIIGYQNGLADKNVTSADLDCYFIATSEGVVPIGYYRNIRPAETVAMVQRYIDECKENIKNEKNRLIVGWQSEVDKVSKIYEQIKDSKNPNILKAVSGAFLAISILVMSVSSLWKMRIISFLLGLDDQSVIGTTAATLPILTGADKNTIITFAICLLIALSVAIAMGFFVAKEINLLNDKKTTNSVQKNILNYVTGLEHGIVDNMNSNIEPLYIAARQGNTTRVVLNKNVNVINNIRKNIKTSLNYVNKTEKERTGINNVILIIGLIVALLLPLTYTEIIPNWVESIEIQMQQANSMNNSTSSTNNSNSSSTDIDNYDNELNDSSNEYEISFDESRDYIYPSDSEYITKEQLDKLTKDEIALLRNEIYARHGYEFQLQQYREYFNRKSWYRPNSYFNESMFNSIEKANKDLIVEYEIEKGWR